MRQSRLLLKNIIFNHGLTLPVMASELSQKVEDIMTRELGQLGKFVIKKQCRDLGIDPENIQPDDIPDVAKAMRKVMITFGGQEKAKSIEMEIRRLIL